METFDCRYLKNIQCVDKNESFYYPVLWLSEVITVCTNWHTQASFIISVMIL